MNMSALLELKKQYELELVRAEAKVAVISDIIDMENREPCECESTYEQTTIPDMDEPTTIPTETLTENY